MNSFHLRISRWLGGIFGHPAPDPAAALRFPYDLIALVEPGDDDLDRSIREIRQREQPQRPMDLG